MKIRNNAIFIIIFIILTLAILSSKSRAATFNIETSECDKRIWIRGDIEKGDAPKLSTQIKEVNDFINIVKNTCILKPNRNIYIHSSGGDVDEAINMGYMIKDNEFNVTIRSIDKCYSSCVLILAAGIKRNPTIAKIGIHRPYFQDLDEKLSLNQIRQRRDLLKIKIRSYLEDMDIDPSLAELMLQTPPNEIKILNESELQRYRLSVPDANYEEREIAKQARFYNLTSSEYRKRDLTAADLCKQYNAKYDRFMNDISGNEEIRITCRESIIHNISWPEYEKRRSSSQFNCKDINDRSELLRCYIKFMNPKP
jgi:ATP-dependent protease ClpP protease subunit